MQEVRDGERGKGGGYGGEKMKGIEKDGSVCGWNKYDKTVRNSCVFFFTWT